MKKIALVLLISLLFVGCAQASNENSAFGESEYSYVLSALDDNSTSFDDNLSHDAISEILSESSYSDDKSCVNNEIESSDDLSIYPDEESSDGDQAEENKYLKAVWITQFDLMSVYVENGAQRNEDSFKKLVTKMLDNIKIDGYNTIMLQARPYADSFYISEFFPVSNYISGRFGNEDIYDAFGIIVGLANERNISVHAWINPMRGMRTSEISSVPDKYLIKKWYTDENYRGKYIVEYDGRVYLNPAYEEVRALIANGAKEICEKYEIDGVHIDDYFYPTTNTSFDESAYKEYENNGGAKSLSKFRNEMLDLMVSGMYSAIKSVDNRLLFGISPVGNIQITYETLYTDVYKWCSEEGYIDYICPQIYFGLEHDTHDFISVFNTWNDIIKTDKVKIYAGMTLGKAKGLVDNYAGSGKNEWIENKDVIKRCLEYLQTRSECEGIIMFCYQHMYNPISGVSVKETEQERNNMKNALEKLS